VITEIRLITGLKITFDFNTIYLGNLPSGLEKHDRYLLQILLVSSKKSITRKWLDKEPPTVAEWIEIVKEIHTMEKMTLSLRCAVDKYTKGWKKWKHYLNRP